MGHRVLEKYWSELLSYPIMFFYSLLLYIRFDPYFLLHWATCLLRNNVLESSLEIIQFDLIGLIVAKLPFLGLLCYRPEFWIFQVATLTCNLVLLVVW